MPFSLLLFLTAVSLDSLTAGFSYGADRVHVKALSLFILSCVPSLFITAADRLGAVLGSLFPEDALPLLSFALLFFLACARLTEGLIRFLARKRPSLMGNWGCRIKELNIVFTVYLSPEDANRTDLSVLSEKEALLLSLALSLDSVLVGMAFSAAAVPALFLFVSASLFHLLLFSTGQLLGRLLARLFSIDLSWLSGLCLLLLAFRALA